MSKTNDLRECCAEVMADPEVRSRYPKEGMTSGDILTEIRSKHPGAFPLVSILDVHDEMEELYS